MGLDRIYGERYKQILLAFQRSYPADDFLSYCARNIVKNIASNVLNIDPNDIIFSRQKYGKPYIKGYPDFHFNISHTKNAIAIAISDYPVGVDVERIRKVEFKIADRFFASLECQYINPPTTGADQRFFEIWTKKEAYVKWIGKGLVQPLNSFDVTSYELKERIRTEVNDGYIVSVRDIGDLFFC